MTRRIAVVSDAAGFTSAAGARPTPGAALYSSARAGANMLVRNLAAEAVDMAFAGGWA